MDNAAKALLMAGGMLIALLIVGAFLLMWNQVSSYQNSGGESKKASQLADFNYEYEKYTDTDIYGYELISLINKAVDFNESDADLGNSFSHDNKITVRVQLGSGFKKKAGASTLFNNEGFYEITNSSSPFYKIINTFTKLEKAVGGVSNMNKLSANYDSLYTYYVTCNGDQKIANNYNNNPNNKYSQAKSIKDVLGKTVDISIENIAQYREYSEFKKSTFETVGSIEYHDNGQIKEISYQFKN